MKRILVIEDEPEMLRNMVTLLTMEGFQAHQASNGRLGVEVARRELPDLVLCDVMMPELDGHGVLAMLRADEATRGLPFIFLTAKGERADVRAGMNLGADDYLTKPVDADELLAAIRGRLERHAEKEEAAQAKVEFAPDFSSAKPLEALGLTPRESEVLLWLAQGKSNPDIAIILGAAEGTVKKHLEHIFQKLSVESRNAASLRALEVLSVPGKG
ncbi:MAG: response regulator transcription factor [Verrucomicrobia bacterium]|nr:response regulator transcription factor [Verrucomicrobiota bacterium]MBI3870270.1 response regulator transcription factor [Verrucomicrobiota bacterium]